MVLLAILGLTIAFSLSFSMTYFFWKENIDQIKEVNKLNNLVLTIALKYGQSVGIEIDIEKHKNNLAELKQNFNTQYFDKQKEVEQNLYERLKTEVSLISLRDKIEARKAKLSLKIKKYNSKNNLKKVQEKQNLFDKNIYQAKETELNTKLLELNLIAKQKVDEFNLLNINIINDVKTKLNNLAVEAKYNDLNNFINSYYNIIYNIEIFYDYEVKKPILLNKNTLKRIEKGELV